jgi:hypothetical protein
MERPALRRGDAFSGRGCQKQQYRIIFLIGEGNGLCRPTPRIVRETPEVA